MSTGNFLDLLSHVTASIGDGVDNLQTSSTSFGNSPALTALARKSVSKERFRSRRRAMFSRS